MRSLGDDYVKSEFRLHRETTNPLHIIGFLSQWKLYLEEVSSFGGGEFRGRKLDAGLFEKMSDEQIGQLYELMHAAKDVWRPVEQDGPTTSSERTDSKNS
ncbi:ACN9-domain-containing protein [Clavulina sp. PMI_390]|nr:ACN9-domain-containing protein [Clavulina sp. PMI_390]